MNRKKIDNRSRVLIENCVTLGHRSLFVIVGEKGRDQVPILHMMLSKSQVKARPTVLWCYKKELGFTTHRKKRMRLLQRKKKAGIDGNDDDPFDQFISSTTIRFCYYHETHRILGNTYGMLILQDFEAMTPNLLARTVETIEGGGMVVILLNTVNSLKQLYTLAMDVHDRYRTEAHQDVVVRFNERFILSLTSCEKCVVINDKLDILPVTSSVAGIKPVQKPDSTTELTPQLQKLAELRESLADTQPVGSLVNCCKTLDQAKALLKFIDTISDKTLSATVSLTAARGRGKSAALGLAIAGAIAFNYSNIIVTSPSPENLNTLFEFILKGFEAMHYKQHIDYEIIQSTNPEFNKAVVRVNVFREHRQTIQYVHPADAAKNKLLGQSVELVVIDEAAAIPLPIVKSLFGPYLVFMASTINGYEGTGRSLSLKLLQQLRKQSSTYSNVASGKGGPVGRLLHELTLDEPIRYSFSDDVEKWLNKLLCLDATIVELPPKLGCPDPKECELFYINRDTLFSYHNASEAFLQRIMALYVASHYKNSPNDLQMMSDAPAHHLFCLLPPVSDEVKATGKLPEVFCFIQICLEGEISRGTLMNSLSRGKRASGDLIPWTISQQFQDENFGSLSGARIVRIATNPNYQRMGYGARALQLIEDYYKGKFNIYLDEVNNGDVLDDDDDDDEEITPKKKLPPLLLALNERKAEHLDYLGVSFGLTAELLKFWKKAAFVPVYLRQTANELTGEHSCIMLKPLYEEENSERNKWLEEFSLDFRKRFISLLAYQFREFMGVLALNILQATSKDESDNSTKLDKTELRMHISPYDLKRLELYSQNLVDYHLIVDLLPTLARFYFLQKLGSELQLSVTQSIIILGMGLQHKSVEDLSTELNIPTSQVLGIFSKTIKKFATYLRSIENDSVEVSLGPTRAPRVDEFNPVEQSLDDELEEGAKTYMKTHEMEAQKIIGNVDLSQYAIKGTEDDWDKATKGKEKSLVSIKHIMPKQKHKLSDIGQNSTEKKKKSFKKFKKH